MVPDGESGFAGWKEEEHEEEEVKSLIRKNHGVHERDVTLENRKKTKSYYMRCAGFITTGIKAPKSPREMGCRSAIPFPVSEHCTE